MTITWGSKQDTNTSEKEEGEIEEEEVRYVTTQALSNLIGRCNIPLNQMVTLSSQRAIEPEWVEDALREMRVEGSIKARDIWPLKVILQSDKEEDVDAIRAQLDLSSDKLSNLRFAILDGQHRQQAALRLLEEKKAKNIPIRDEERVWNCEVYKRGELVLSHNKPRGA